MMNLRRTDLAGRVGFSIGTGRCGTEFMARVVGLEPGVSAVHERNPYNETFHRYCQWYGLAVDGEGFLHQKEKEIRHDLESHNYSFESSAYLSLSVIELYERFGARFLLLVRSPERVVNSFLHKGWYAAPTVRADPNLAPGYQECESFHHVLARFVPSGEKFEQWNEMTRVGKIAWYWNAMNARILEQLERLSADAWRIEKIEGLDYERYCEAARFLGFGVTIGASEYAALVTRRPNKFTGVPTIAAWDARQVEEFEAEASPMAEVLGYEYRVERLPVPQEQPPAEEKRTLVERLRSSILR